MAVHAQYPSNALFLNRNVQESDKTTNFSIQAQTDEAFPDKIQSSHMMIFNSNKNGNINHNNNDIINQHKRRRNTSSAPINSFSTLPHHQQQQPQILEVSQLHHPSPNPLGLKLSSSNPNPIHSSFLSDHITHQLKQQQHEIDQLLHFQGEQLQRILSEKRQHHYQTLLTAADESLKRQLHAKQSELQKALRRNTELEAQAINLQNELHFWQAKARAQKSTAASLQSQLQQALINNGIRNGVFDEVEQRRSELDDAESVFDDPDRVLVVDGMERFVCKVCRRRQANVVMLPCRHLCVCAVCDCDVAACPYCFTVKNSGVEVFMP